MRDDETATIARPKSLWDNIEQGAKILSLVAIPVILAVVGWVIQDSLTRRSASQEYVKLAVSIERDRFELSYTTRLNRGVGLYFGLRA